MQDDNESEVTSSTDVNEKEESDLNSIFPHSSPL